MLLRFAAISGQLQKYVEQSEPCTALGHVGVVVGLLALLCSGKNRSQSGQGSAL